MLSTRIIPCFDVKDGRVVKGVNFVNLVDTGDPVELARAYDAQGADEICLLDITASSDNRNILLNVVKKTADVCFTPLVVGGGVRCLDDIYALLKAGADKVSINTSAITNPSLVGEAAKVFGSQCIVVAIDVKQTGNDADHYEVYTHGGRVATGLEAVAWAQKITDMGAGELLVTSMNKDGMRSGFDLGITRRIADSVGVPIIASGGVGCPQDLVDGVKLGGASAVLAASIFHFGDHSIQDVKAHMASAGIVVRSP